MEDQLSRTES